MEESVIINDFDTFLILSDVFCNCLMLLSVMPEVSFNFGSASVIVIDR